MEKPILYIDCDGVTYDTIDTAFDIMRKNGCDMSKKEEIDYYFRVLLDWEEVFNQAPVINNSIEKIKILNDSQLFKAIMILTKLSGNYYEEKIKRDIFKNVLPMIRVITLEYRMSKASIVKAEGNILVDDEYKNYSEWLLARGTPVKFDKNKVNLNNNIINDLLDIPNTRDVKKLLKQMR